MADEELMFGDLFATVRVQDLPASREVVAVERQDDGAWRVCGSAVASADGIAELGIEGSKTSRIYAVAIDHWGEPFIANKPVKYGDVIRPSVFLGWLYRVTAPGTLPDEEPAWWNSTPGMPRPVGTATAQAEMYFQPIAHGPVDIEWGEEPPAPDLPTIIGEFFQGGYYIGDIEDQGQMYKVLVAPIEADVYGLQWKTANNTTAGTDSLTDGWSNTWSMNIGDHPAASHCLDYRGGGHDDWYMPAKNELNLFWLNIAPGKTQVPEFQSGGEQALHGSQYYWASTQYSSNFAWSQRFSDGYQGSTSKTSTYRRARPVRRLPFKI